MVLKFTGGAVQSVFTTGLGGVAPCLAASSNFTCPTDSNAFKIIVNGGAEATVCVNGWQSSDGAASSTVTRRLVVTSSDDSFDRGELKYTCTFGAEINAATNLTTAFDCTATTDGTKLIFAECATLCLGTAVECAPTRKRAQPVVATSAIAFALASNGRGDPHLVGPEGVKYKFGGVANGTYALFTAPAFVVNMQLAASGPLNRFMTSVGVVLEGEAVVITPQLRRDAAALTKFFEAHGASVTFKEDDVGSMTVTLCNDHALTIEARSLNAKFDYLNVAVSVPGCHDAYGGALGQTYRCEYVHGTKPFVWSHAQEESFRVASLGAPSGTYSPTADCAHEDEYQGQQPFSGGSTTTPDGAVTMRHGSASAASN